MRKNISIPIMLAWILSIVAFHYHHFFLGILGLTISCVIFVSRLRETINAREKYHFILNFEVRLPNVINHPTIEKLFQKLSEQKLLKEEVTFEDWKKALLVNSDKSDQKNSWRKRFDIKSDIVWKDLNFYPGDAIEHTIEVPIPYFKNRSGDWLLSESNTSLGITIRVINGILKLQFGPLSCHISPVILEKEPIKKYQEYFTITSFPLIYFAGSTCLPTKYLAQSYSTVGDDNEFKEMIGDFHAYNYLVDTNAKHPRYEDSVHKENSKWRKIVRNFGEKGKAWLKKENFVSLYDEDDIARRVIPGIEGYENSYLKIEFWGKDQEDLACRSDFAEVDPV